MLKVNISFKLKQGLSRSREIINKTNLVFLSTTELRNSEKCILIYCYNFFFGMKYFINFNNNRQLIHKKPFSKKLSLQINLFLWDFTNSIETQKMIFLILIFEKRSLHVIQRVSILYFQNNFQS